MMTQKKGTELKRFDTKELEVPETLFVRDIENRVFQNIVAQCLARIRDVALVGGGFIDNILGRSGTEGVGSVQAEQDSSNHSLRIRVEVNIGYGVSIPEKAEEIQSKVAEDITRLTGLHVACVHVVFKDLIPPSQPLKQGPAPRQATVTAAVTESIEDEYSDEFIQK